MVIPAAETVLCCPNCLETFPVIHGIPRMLLSPMRDAVRGEGETRAGDASQVNTALSFGFEWSHFSEMYEEWEHNFLDYMAPRRAEIFRGKRVLDVGCGSGRHAYYAARNSAAALSGS